MGGTNCQKEKWAMYKAVGCDWKNGKYVIPEYKKYNNMGTDANRINEVTVERREERMEGERKPRKFND